MHRRGINDNELVIEVKIQRSRRTLNIERDLAKLRAFQHPDKGYKYRQAFLCIIDCDKTQPTFGTPATFSA